MLHFNENMNRNELKYNLTLPFFVVYIINDILDINS